MQVLVYDGSKIVKGVMDVGQVAPEPTGGTEEIASYRGAYKSSIACFLHLQQKNWIEEMAHT